MGSLGQLVRDILGAHVHRRYDVRRAGCHGRLYDAAKLHNVRQQQLCMCTVQKYLQDPERNSCALSSRTWHIRSTGTAVPVGPSTSSGLTTRVPSNSRLQPSLGLPAPSALVRCRLGGDSIVSSGPC